jgi:beta-ketoacyl-acyl-carrier-protein synthase II
MLSLIRELSFSDKACHTFGGAIFMTRRVVITGFGAITPLAHSAEETWQGIKAGKSGIDYITRFDTTDYNIKVAAEIKHYDPTQYMALKEVRRRDRYQQYVEIAASQAIRHANFEVNDINRQQTGMFIGSSVGGIETYYEMAHLLFETHDPRRITPFGIPMLIVDGANNMTAIEVGAMGPSYVVVSACATGADNIGQATDLIRLGRIDQALAGCGDSPIIPIGIAAFDRIGAVSREAEVPSRASRPFAKDRPGLVFGEGAAVVAVEALESAQARGATIHAEIVGYGSTTDAFHITAPHPEGIGASAAMQRALDDAKLQARDIQYINAHGTGTGLNDSMETKAIKRVFGEYAYKIPISSTKSMTGHGMGMTAALEVIFSVLAIRDQIAPPTINLDEPDPECDLDYVPNTARPVPMQYVMSNSFGFGGHNAALIIRAYQP